MCVYTYIQWNIFHPEKKEILTFTTTWTNLEGIMLRIIQTQRRKNCISLICGTKRVKYIKNREQNAGYQGQGRGNRRDIG